MLFPSLCFALASFRVGWLVSMKLEHDGETKNGTRTRKEDTIRYSEWFLGQPESVKVISIINCFLFLPDS
jgi:hypothetical protein